jgi:hypothetical protein
MAQTVEKLWARLECQDETLDEIGAFPESLNGGSQVFLRKINAPDSRDSMALITWGVSAC